MNLDQLIKIGKELDFQKEEGWKKLFEDNGFSIEHDMCIVNRQYANYVLPIPTLYKDRIRFSSILDEKTAMVFVKGTFY